MAKNRIKLNILDTDYMVMSDDEESYVREIGSKVDKRMREILTNNPRLSVNMAAVLVSLDYCDEAQKAKDSSDNLRSQIKEYLEDSSRSRMEADEARREIERMKREVQMLRQRLSEQEHRQVSASSPAQKQSAQSSPMTRQEVSPGQTRLYTKPQPIGQGQQKPQEHDPK